MNDLAVRELIAYVQSDGRVCPNPQEWQILWDTLPNKKRVGQSWVPPIPLILAAWYEPDFAKQKRLEEHIKYAEANDCLNEVSTYLKSLGSDQWFYG